MPILYKGNERVLFAHIPKTAGTSLYVWFAKNKWVIANLNLLPNIGTGVEFKKRFGITQCQLEGVIPTKASPQHATKEYFDGWGEFTSSFCVVRHPLSRVISEIGYTFPSFCVRNGIKKIKEKDVEHYVKSFFEKFIEPDVESGVLDNHLRSQVDFICSGMPVLYYEGSWKEWLKNKYQLEGELPVLNNSSGGVDFKNFIDSRMESMVFQKYKKDYEILGYPRDPDEVIAL
ncbi:MAG: hypothetical protein ACQEW0_05685 [Pseudomonadota bacterium]